MKVFIIADVPDALGNAWLQHVREFDQAHPGCHFQVLADAPDLSTEQMVEALRVDPELTFTEIIRRIRPG